MHQMNGDTVDLVEVYIEYTDIDVWLPLKYLRSHDFIHDFITQNITRDTVLAFSKVNSLGYENIPLPHYLPGLERFLGRLQLGERTIAKLYCGQCPHVECPRYINNQDTGHFCLAMSGQFTDHHVGRAKLIEYGHIQA